jgi:hypothetical protein
MQKIRWPTGQEGFFPSTAELKTLENAANGLRIFQNVSSKFLLEDYRLIVERSFARPNDPESYAGGSVSSW